VFDACSVETAIASAGASTTTPHKNTPLKAASSSSDADIGTTQSASSTMQSTVASKCSFRVYRQARLVY